jgi:hypothetical protein
MRRREFIAGLGAVASWPVVAANALDAASPIVGFLVGISYKGPLQYLWAAFREGLASLGYVEGQNLRIELREADGHYERLLGIVTFSNNQEIAVARREVEIDELCTYALDQLLDCWFSVLGRGYQSFGIILGKPSACD